MNSKHKGVLAIGAAISFFTEQGTPVLIPISDSEKYDLAIDQGEIKKVQCKYTSAQEPSGGFNVDLRTFGGYRNKTYFIKYQEGDFDFLFVYCSNGDKYLIPADKIIKKVHLTIGINSWKEFKC